MPFVDVYRPAFLYLNFFLFCQTINDSVQWLCYTYVRPFASNTIIKNLKSFFFMVIHFGIRFCAGLFLNVFHIFVLHGSCARMIGASVDILHWFLLRTK